MKVVITILILLALNILIIHLGVTHADVFYSGFICGALACALNYLVLVLQRTGRTHFKDGYTEYKRAIEKGIRQ